MFKLFLSSLLILSIYLSTSLTEAQTISCLNLQSDLKSGMTSNVVTSLQEYLLSANYLKVKPNGYFGPATLAAVKKFQIANSISGTGIVGTLTRALIQKKSCIVSTVVNNASQTASIINSSPFISPKSGELLRIGDTVNISWNVDTNYPHDIILEYPNGAGAGYIVKSLLGEKNYNWVIGNVYDSGVQDNINVATGTYRIRIRKVNAGIINDDPVSPLFTLTAPQLSVDSLSRSTIKADDKEEMVIFGNGFDSSSYIKFDEQYGATAHILYRSSNGKLLVFSVPSNISSGYHTVMVTNNYGMISNSLNVNIIK